MNTPGRTVTEIRRNAWSPVRCCSGVPAHRWQSARPNVRASPIDRPSLLAYKAARSVESTVIIKASADSRALSTPCRSR